MTIVWTAIGGLLYVELLAIAILLVPIISPQRWRKIFATKFCQAIGAWGTFYFRAVLFTLSAFFLDSIRETYKYEGMHGVAEKEITHHGVDMERINMHLFHAQRNLFISGFALFCCFVLNRLVKLMNELALTEAQSTAAMAQARSAGEVAKNLMDSSSSKDKKAAEGNAAKKSDEEALKRELTELRATLKKTTADFEAMQAQSASVAKEYDRLCTENEKLQAELEQLQEGDNPDNSNKKNK